MGRFQLELIYYNINSVARSDNTNIRLSLNSLKPQMLSNNSEARIGKPNIGI